jgi:antitoxin component YwqK of YwqJK toxin-antitoxin module
MDNYEIYIGDTLIGKSDFIKNGQNLPSKKAKELEFKPIFDGLKIAYFIDGNIYSKGEIKNLKENGYWEYWYSNGKKAREGMFLNGKPNGIHKYWYENGQLRGIGNWKNGIYDGKWEMYNENGKEKIVQNYKDGKLIE